MRRVLACVLAVFTAGAAGCSSAKPAATAGDRLRVEAAFYPIVYVAQRIGGADVSVDNLTPPGAEPHDLELSFDQVGAIRRADLTVYLKGFQPAVDQAVRAAKALDLATVQPLDAPDDGLRAEDSDAGVDVHVWLDPLRVVGLANAIRDRLIVLRPAERVTFTSNAAALVADLRKLDADYRSGLATCTRKDFVTSHAAFGYVARRYGLQQVGIAGLSPDEEVSPGRLREVAVFVRERKITTIFFESLVSPKLAETIAHATNVKTAVLNPIEGLAHGDGDYLSVMRANLAALRAALDCT